MPSYSILNRFLSVPFNLAAKPTYCWKFNSRRSFGVLMKKDTRHYLTFHKSKLIVNIFRIAAIAILTVSALVITQRGHAQKKSGSVSISPPIQQQVETKTFAPVERPVMVFSSINLRQVARQQALESSQSAPAEIRAIHAPKGDVPPGRRAVSLPAELSNFFGSTQQLLGCLRSG